MDKRDANPFDLTKAADLSDQQIEQLWVDIPGKASLINMAKPASKMPMLILGGKGSGKTHLMRYLSFPLQQLRYGDDILGGLKNDGYIGIYFRCDGLNTARFTGKGQAPEKWRAVFGYYMELWLGQLALGVAADIFRKLGLSHEAEEAFCVDLMGLLDRPAAALSTLHASLDYLRQLQKSVDIAVNNSSMTQRLDVEILTSPGSLIFGIPRIVLAQLPPALKKSVVVYLVDELENLSKDQQRYINTLVREKATPCTLKIGARLYGIKTYQTYSGHEDIKQGSEFEVLSLDELMRDNKTYPAFARSLVERRLMEVGLAVPADGTKRAINTALDSVFELPPNGRFHDGEARRVVTKYEKSERPYFKALRLRLAQGRRVQFANGIASDVDAETVIDHLRIAEYPLLEKANILSLYKAWNRRQHLVRAARDIDSHCRAFLRNADSPSPYAATFRLFKTDLLAQLLRDCEQKQRYVGLPTFISMSQGFPRNLLIILKHIFAWSLFNGESPFQREQISIDSQREGVSQASLWFLDDARTAGDDGIRIRAAIERLATLFRSIRFSDKPAECSLVTFSCDLANVSSEATNVIDLCEKWSLLIRIRRGQRDRNTKRVDSKYQLNSMLSPKWDLPVARRGVIALSPSEVDAIFSPIQAPRFKEVLGARIDRMSAPLFGRHPTLLRQTVRSNADQQRQLPLE